MATSLVRAVTDDEVLFFREHGWVCLRRLLEPAIVPGILSYAESVLRTSEYRYSSYVDKAFRQYMHADRSNRTIHEITHSATMGDNASRLLRGRPRVRLMQCALMAKYGAGDEDQGSETPFHQDYPAHPLDRSEMLVCWIALVDITPEMGSMRFYEGSHRYGAIGRAFLDEHDDIRSQAPWLRELELSPPLTLAPGDATIHHGLVIHGAPENRRSTPRHVLQAGYFDAAALYTGAPFKRFDDLGLTVNKPFDHPELPLIGARDS